MPHSTPALLIIDMFNHFAFEHGARLARQAVAIAPAIARLRDRFDRVGAPVIYINDNFAHWQGDFRDLVAHCSTLPGAPSAIASTLSPKAGHYYILKPKHSAFLATPLPLLLSELGARQLVLTGVSTDSCILATAQDANMRELEVWCPTDAVAAITPQRHERALALMAASLGAQVGSSRRTRGLFPKKG